MLWIILLLVVILIVDLIYARLILKRLILIRKISKSVKKQSGNIRYCRNPLTSVFKRDGSVDLFINLHKKSIAVSIITTPFRRMRYHFNNNDLLELIVERRSVYITNHSIPKPTSVMDRYYTLRKYKIKFDDLASETKAQRYVIVHPAPISISKVDGANFTPLYNNDILFHQIKICGLKYFIDNVI